MFGKGVEGNSSSGYNESSAGQIGIVFKSGEDMIKYFMAHKA
jgi:hypothetical protein